MLNCSAGNGPQNHVQLLKSFFAHDPIIARLENSQSHAIFAQTPKMLCIYAKTCALLLRTLPVFVHTPTSLFCITLHPVLRSLVESLAVLPILIRDGRLDGVIGIGLDQKGLNEAQDSDDLIRWLPLIWAQ